MSCVALAGEGHGRCGAGIDVEHLSGAEFNLPQARMQPIAFVTLACSSFENKSLDLKFYHNSSPLACISDRWATQGPGHQHAAAIKEAGMRTAAAPAMTRAVEACHPGWTSRRWQKQACICMQTPRYPSNCITAVVQRQQLTIKVPSKILP